jgi:hypothetical protein
MPYYYYQRNGGDKMEKHISLCDEYSEWVSCPVCDEHTVCAYCVEYLLDGTFTDCAEIV